MLSLWEIKGRLGYLVNQKTEPWFGAHVSLRRAFPYLVVAKLPQACHFDCAQDRFLTVRIDITNRCNLRCKMCYFSMKEVQAKPREEMPVTLFRKIAQDVLPAATQLIISAGAEPLYAKQFPAMLAIIAGYHVPHVAFFTNGTLLTPDLSATILRTGVNVITISFDGATPQTYEAIRRGAKFDQVIRNIQVLQDLKKQAGSATPALHFGVVLMKMNIAELPDILRLAHTLGIARVTASHVVPYAELGTKEESLRRYPDLADTYLARARQVAQEFALPFDAPPNFAEPRAAMPASCEWPWREILIRPDGSVHPCCYWYEDTSMGNFAAQAFQEIWQGPAYAQLRRELTAKAYRPGCAHCPALNPEHGEVKIVNDKT